MPCYGDESVLAIDELQNLVQIFGPGDEVFNSAGNKFAIFWLECQISKLPLFCNIEHRFAIIIAIFNHNELGALMSIEFLGKS